VTLDVAERKQVQEAIQTTVDRFGRLDVMFNNAGFNKPVPFMGVDEDNFIERVGRDWGAAGRRPRLRARPGKRGDWRT
jgi:NAD(P)-dependent dehydrogenase (short-subunit alcohol dehydrogenase family)